MSKIALAGGLAGLVLAAASTTGSSAMPVVPLSKMAISGTGSDLEPGEMATMLARPLGKSSLPLVLARSLGTRSLRVSATLRASPERGRERRPGGAGSGPPSQTRQGGEIQGSGPPGQSERAG
jgi:hypothetical protein